MKHIDNHIAFIESNTTGTGKLFLESAKQKGYQPLFFTSSPDKYPFLKTGLVRPIILNTKNPQEILSYLNQYDNLKGIFSSSESYIEIAAYLANLLKLPGNDSKDIGNCRNKDLLSKILEKHGICCPKTESIHSMNELELLLDQNKTSFPALVKPSCGTGSIGVRLCYNKNEIHQHVNQLLVTQQKEFHQKSIIVLIQEYIDANEYSVETLGIDNTINLIGITKKYLHALPNFVESGHDFPAILPEKTQTKIFEEVRKALTALHLFWGPVHTEVRIKNGIPYIIEVNPRLAGGMIPKLIQTSLNFDIISATIDLVTGKNNPINVKHTTFSSIRFLIPQESGLIKNVTCEQRGHPAIIDFKITRSTNDFITLSGNFSDRIGYVIVSDNNPIKCKNIADLIINSTSINIERKETGEKMGRLSVPLLPEAQRLIQDEATFYNKEEELTLLANVDEAHIIMLHKTGHILEDHAKKLLLYIQELRKNSFKSVLQKSSPRGTYILYEENLIEHLGLEGSGNIHIGRSRNDINATLFILQLRKYFFHTYETLWQFRSTLINQAKKYLKTSFPIYSQYQTALPGTFGHYLLAIECALTRDQMALKALYPHFDRCPLGAAAGGGTTLVIDPTFTAKLLGFKYNHTNSLDAVASRDLALRILATLDICAMTLGRITTDLQIWSTSEFNFIQLPDNLSGGSSMMPQKKNPYLLEKIRGRLSKLLSHYVAAATTMHKVPFGNSVEISAESIKPLVPAFDDFNSAISLLELIIKKITLINSNIKKSQVENLTMSTYITDILLKKDNIPFREAHITVGQKIREASELGLNPYDALLSISKNVQEINFDPLEIALKMEYGYGPGEKSTLTQYHTSVSMLNQDNRWLNKKLEFINQSDLIRNQTIEELLKHHQNKVV